ncbi:hypothetical protein Tco_0281925 [Tanacetum coccineum]
MASHLTTTYLQAVLLMTIRCRINDNSDKLQPMHHPQPNFQIAVDILKQTTSHETFTAYINNTLYLHYSTILGTICFDRIAGKFCMCQWTSNWFYLNQDTLRDALQNHTVDNTGLPLLLQTPIPLVNLSIKLGFPKESRALVQAESPVLQNLWVLFNGSYIEYAERMWKNLLNPSHTFTEVKGSCTTYSREIESNSFLFQGISSQSDHISHATPAQISTKEPNSPSTSAY